jgi:hypothetical protein
MTTAKVADPQENRQGDNPEENCKDEPVELEAKLWERLEASYATGLPGIAQSVLVYYQFRARNERRVAKVSTQRMMHDLKFSRATIQRTRWLLAITGHIVPEARWWKDAVSKKDHRPLSVYVPPSRLRFSCAIRAMGWLLNEDLTVSQTESNPHGLTDRPHGLTDRPHGLCEAQKLDLKGESKKERSVCAYTHPKTSTKRSIPLPENFKISEPLRDWATQEGYDAEMLDDYMEHFTGWALAKGARTADWDGLFKQSIEEDWAGICV